MSHPPISLALPWLNISDLAGHLPLPAKITIEVQEPIEVDGDDDMVNKAVLASLQAGVDRPGRRAQVPGDRLMRVERQLVMKADRTAVWDLVSDPDRYPSFMPNLERWETVTEGPAEIGSRFTVHWKVGAAPVGGVIELVEFDTARDLAWISITGVSIRGRFRLRDAGSAAPR